MVPQLFSIAQVCEKVCSWPLLFNIPNPSPIWADNTLRRPQTVGVVENARWHDAVCGPVDTARHRADLQPNVILRAAMVQSSSKIAVVIGLYVTGGFTIEHSCTWWASLIRDPRHPDLTNVGVGNASWCYPTYGCVRMQWSSAQLR